MSSAQAVAPDAVLVRYGELSLKGGNRRHFENALVRNVRSACREIAEARVERVWGRLAVFPERRVESVARRLQQVFGITSVSPARTVPSELEAIVSAAGAALEEALGDWPPEARIPFAVRTRRADKTFPLTSTEVDAHVAEQVARDPRLTVNLSHPELTLGIDLRRERTYVFARRLPGPGGLPVGTLGRVVCLLSGGIDSPVAAWMAMKRGASVHYVTFHSYPYIGEPSKKKVVDLVRVLARWQPASSLTVVPFAKIQETIRDHAPAPYRTVLYRRMMQRIAGRIARDRRAGAVVTGESLGQVASQTLENLTCIGAASELPVLRPLIAFDKEETIALARRIGTYEVSILPEPDCCTVFQPERPVIRGRLEECLRAEERYDAAGLADRAAGAAEQVEVA